MTLTSTVDADDAPSMVDGGSWFVTPLHDNKNQTQYENGSWFVAEEEEEESNEEEEKGSARETGPRGHQHNTKMALRKKKNQRLCEEEEESKGLCEEEEEETATERERVAGEKESSVFFLK